MFKKVFIETSVLVRFLTRDDEEKYRDCEIFFEKIGSGELRPYLSSIVVLELIFVLTKLYKFPKKKVLKDVGLLLGLRNLVLVERIKTAKALSLFSKFKAGYADCLLASQVPLGVVLVTYDKHFSQMSFLNTVSPAEFG
ncbi:PIN domain-containing protein [Patescibacteria group bacterium]